MNLQWFDCLLFYSYYLLFDKIFYANDSTFPSSNERAVRHDSSYTAITLFAYTL